MKQSNDTNQEKIYQLARSPELLDFRHLNLRDRLKYNAFPLLVFALLLIFQHLPGFKESSGVTYMAFALYVLVVAYYLILDKGLFLQKIKLNWQNKLNEIWLQVAHIAFMYLMIGVVVSILSSLYPSFSLIEYKYPNHTILLYILDALRFVLLAPIAECMLFQRGLLEFENKNRALAFSVVSAALFACLYSLHWTGFIKYWILGFCLNFIYSSNEQNIYLTISSRSLLNLCFWVLNMLVFLIKG